MIIGEKYLSRGNRKMFNLWLLITIILGATFLIGQVTEYAKLYADNVTIHGSGEFGTTFFTLTGFHGFHVFVGLIALSTIAVLGWGRAFVGGKRRVAVDTVSIYWHFVDAVWVVILSLVYLLGQVA
jgi:heme/copper-type cytochrome/quinol oxidase subunit 3